MAKKILTGAIKGICILFLLVFILLARLQIAGDRKVVFNKEHAARISYSALEEVVPGGNLPKKLKSFRSNNNLDIVQYKGRYYFAYRTAPTHFASTKTMLYVLSSKDAKKWDYETEIYMGSDLREPRFLAYKGKLFMYFFQGGTKLTSFEPNHMYGIVYQSPGKWTKPVKIYEPGYVVWRAKVHNGKALMSVYYGVGLYSNETEPTHLRLLESDDGIHYTLLDGKEVSAETSAEEGEFEFDDDGSLYATLRLEMKGGKVCRAPAADLTNWTCKFSAYKYDSALMFRHGGEFYVVARRNVAGSYNRSSKLLPRSLRSKWYLVRYSLSRKRTALYRLNKEKLTLEPLFDFPSRGDTAYAGITQIGKNKYLLFNYSSDINKFDWSWLGGQMTGSNIYATTLTFK